MSVRRLADKELQPAEFVFSDDNLVWAREQLAKYPDGRQASAVIPLLWRAQEQAGGWVTEAAIRYVGEFLDLAYIRVLEIATFYTMFQLAPVGRKAHVQLCGTTPCMLRGAEALLEVCRHRIHHDPHHVSDDGDFSWEEVECLGACVNAPMVQVWSDTYEDLTAETFNAVLDGFARGEPPRPGPQIDRQFSAPLGGETTLTDASLYDGGTKSQPQSGTQTQTHAGPAVVDADAKKPSEGASQREEPAPKAPAADATKTDAPSGVKE